MLITPPATYLVDVPSDADEFIADQPDGQALAAFMAGPDLSTEDAYNAWQQTTAPIGYRKWDVAEQAHARTGRFDLAAALAYFGAAPPEDLAARISAVTAPTLVVAGAQDCLTGFAPVLALAELFPNGEVAVIDECGHYPWVERPGEFRAVADDFLFPI